MVLGHLFFGCILGGRLWNAGPIFLGLSMFFFFHVWLDGVFSGSRLKSERSMDSKSACEMFLLMFFAGSHFPRIKRGGPRSPGTSHGGFQLGNSSNYGFTGVNLAMLAGTFAPVWPVYSADVQKKQGRSVATRGTEHGSKSMNI